MALGRLSSTPVVDEAPWRAVAVPRRQPLSTSCAYWGLIGLAVLSVLVRPVVEGARFPRVLLNLDAVLLPVVAAAVLLSALVRWRQLTRLVRGLCVVMVLLGSSTVVSWYQGEPATFAGLALAFASVLLLPLVLLLAAIAAEGSGVRTGLFVLRVLVLMQLVVGTLQYVTRHVAQQAPFAADMVNGTTSHNFWPVFALPAAMVLVLADRWRWRIFWPVAVVLLAIYSEAKAALIVFLPTLALISLLSWARDVRSGGGLRARLPREFSTDRALGWAVGVMTAIIVGLGVFWSPSVQGTWLIFKGHAQSLEDFAKNTEPYEGDPVKSGSFEKVPRGAEERERTAGRTPTLRDASRVLSEILPNSTTTLLFGLGPGNSVSHAAEVLAGGAANGASLPRPSLIASSLLVDEGDIAFEDAQSSVLGLWGDLGTVGAALYAAAVGLATAVLLRSASGLSRLIRLLSIGLVVGGLMVGGVLLDWTEQAAIVIPIGLILLVLCRIARPDPHLRPTGSQIKEVG